MWHRLKAYGCDMDVNFQGNMNPTFTHISTSSQGYGFFMFDTPCNMPIQTNYIL